MASTQRGALALAVCLGTVVPNALAGQWVESPGKGWVALAVYHQDTRKEYRSGGDRREIFPQGHAVTTSSFLTLATGLVQGVDVWVQLGFHNLNFDDASGDRSSTGFGDTRVWVRAAPLKWLGSDFPFAIRAGLKIPFGDFDVNSEIIPLGDGQRDWEVMGELGHSFWPRSLYVMGWVGYRWREENTESFRDFGNETFFFAQFGGEVGPVGYKMAVEGWDGASGVSEGLLIPSFQRDLVQIQPSISHALGPGQLEAGARITLGGKNLPAGTALLLQYFTRLSLF